MLIAAFFSFHSFHFLSLSLHVQINRHVDYSDPDKMQVILEILGMTTKPHKASPSNCHSDVATNNMEANCSASDPGHNEALLVVREILEERIDVAVEVSWIVHETNDLQDRGHSDVAFSFF